MWEKLTNTFKDLILHTFLKRNERKFGMNMSLFVGFLILSIISPNIILSQTAVYTDTVTVSEDDTLKASWLKPLPELPSVDSYKLTFVHLALLDVQSFPIYQWYDLPEDPDRVYAVVNIELNDYGDHEMYLIARNSKGDSGASNKIFFIFEEGAPDAPREFTVIVVKKKKANP